jgi:TonB family protein
MFEPKNLVPKTTRLLAAAPQAGSAEERKQRRMMVIALVLLLVALGFVLYRDRDFWAPDNQETEDQPPRQTTPAATPQTQTVVAPPASAAHKKSHSSKPQPKGSAPAAPPVASNLVAPPITATTTRTVLPPLEVEVVAGDFHRTVHPGTNSVRVDLQPGSAPQSVAVPSAVSRASDADNANAAGVTSKAAERVQMSADTAEIVSRPVKPDYPLLARQMKVQGSVILQALIGRDGLIQGLRVVSGPPILAGAAQEAVKQWHFKPHLEGAESVETQARITVNFTISTN